MNRIALLFLSLFCLSATSAVPFVPLISCKVEPLNVRLEREILDGFEARSIVISNKEVEFRAPESSLFKIMTTGTGIVRIIVPEIPDFTADIAFYPVLDCLGNPLEDYMPEYLDKIEVIASQQDVNFVRDDSGSIAYRLKGDQNSRDIRTPDDTLIHNSSWTTYPLIFGHRYFLLEYEVIRNRDQLNEVRTKVSEALLNIGYYDVRIVIQASSENYERLQPKIINYIESFITDFSYEDKMFSHPPE
jgi:hypothetical protein